MVDTFKASMLGEAAPGKVPSKQADTPNIWYTRICTDTDRQWEEARQEEDTTQEKPKMIFLLYLKRVLEHIQCVGKRVEIRAAFKSLRGLQELLTKVKTPLLEVVKKGVLYRVPCMNFDESHISEM